MEQENLIRIKDSGYGRVHLHFPDKKPEPVRRVAE